MSDPTDDTADRAPTSRLLDGVRQVAHNTNDALNGLSDAAGLTPRVQESPYGMLAAALGVGYVVGGGLFTPTTARLIRLGMKLAAIPLVRDRLLDAAEGAVDGILRATTEAPASSPPDTEVAHAAEDPAPKPS